MSMAVHDASRPLTAAAAAAAAAPDEARSHAQCAEAAAAYWGRQTRTNVDRSALDRAMQGLPAPQASHLALCLLLTRLEEAAVRKEIATGSIADCLMFASHISTGEELSTELLRRIGPEAIVVMAVISKSVPVLWHAYLKAIAQDIIADWTKHLRVIKSEHVADLAGRQLPAINAAYDRPRDTDTTLLSGIHTALWITAQDFFCEPCDRVGGAYTRRDPSVPLLATPFGRLLTLLYDWAPAVIRSTKMRSCNPSGMTSEAVAEHANQREVLRHFATVRGMSGTLRHGKAVISDHTIGFMSFYPAFYTGETCTPLPFGACGLVAPSFSPGACAATAEGDSLRHNTEGYAGSRAFALLNTLRAKLHKREHYPMRYGSVEEYALKFITHDSFTERMKKRRTLVEKSTTKNAIDPTMADYGLFGVRMEQPGCNRAHIVPPTPLLYLAMLDVEVAALMAGLPTGLMAMEAHYCPTMYTDAAIVAAAHALGRTAFDNVRCKTPAVHTHDVCSFFLNVVFMHACVAGGGAILATGEDESNSEAPESESSWTTATSLLGCKNAMVYKVMGSLGKRGARPTLEPSGPSFSLKWQGCDRGIPAPEWTQGFDRWLPLVHAAGLLLASDAERFLADRPNLGRGAAASGEWCTEISGVKMGAYVSRHEGTTVDSVDDPRNVFKLHLDLIWDATTDSEVDHTTLAAVLAYALYERLREADKRRCSYRDADLFGSSFDELYEAFERAIGTKDTGGGEDELEDALWEQLPAPGQEVHQGQPYVEWMREALVTDPTLPPHVELRLHLGASVLRLCILVGLVEHPLFARVVNSLHRTGIVQDEHAFQALLLVGGVIDAAQAGSPGMRRCAEIPEVLIAHAVPRLVRELKSSDFVTDPSGVDRGMALLSYRRRATLGALAGEDVAVDLKADPWAQKWAQGDELLGLWGRAEATPTLEWLRRHFPSLVWPLYSAGGTSWTEDDLKLVLRLTDVDSEESTDLAEQLMMPKPHGLGLAPPENKPFLKRLHRNLYAPPDTAGAAYLALANAPHNAALDGTQRPGFPADEPRKAGRDGRDSGAERAVDSASKRQRAE